MNDKKLEILLVQIGFGLAALSVDVHKLRKSKHKVVVNKDLNASYEALKEGNFEELRWSVLNIKFTAEEKLNDGGARWYRLHDTVTKLYSLFLEYIKQSKLDDFVHDSLKGELKEVLCDDPPTVKFTDPLPSGPSTRDD